jgi:hypothetical protein
MFKFMCLDNPRKRFQLTIEGEGEGEGAGGVVIEEGSEEAQQSSNGSAGSQGRSQSIPYERFSQVNREKQELAKQLEAYKKFGSVEKLASEIARSKELTTGKRFTDAEVKALEEDLKQVPELKNVFEFVNEQKAEREEISKQFINDAAGKVSTLVKELGFDLKNPDDRKLLEFDIQAVIAERIKQTPGWLARWKRNDMSVVTDAWNKVKGIYGWTRRSNNADIQAKKLQQGARPGASGAVGKDGKPTDGIPRTAEGKVDERAVLAAASERGFARLKASEE